MLLTFLGGQNNMPSTKTPLWQESTAEALDLVLSASVHSSDIV